MKKTAIVALSMLTFTIAAKSDFSACREFLQPPIGEEVDSNPFLGNNSPQSPFFNNPFIVKEDGSLEAKTGVDVKRSEDGLKEVFSTKEPYMKFDAKTPFGERKIEERAVEYTVDRNDKGEILSIRREMRYLDSDINEYVSTQSKAITDAIKKRYESMAKQQDRVLTEEEKTFMQNEIERSISSARLGLPTGNTVNFEHRNGKCLATSNKANSMIAQDKEADEIETTIMDTALCRDVSEFLKQNPEAQACFKKDLNARMSQVFAKHADKFNDEMSKSFGVSSPLMFGGFGGMGLGSGFGMGGYGGMGFGSSGLGRSIAQNVLMSQPDRQEEFINERKDLNAGQKAEMIRQWQEGMRKSNILSSTSPVIRGQQLLEGCYFQGVKNFINDDDLWKDEASKDSIDATSTTVESK